MEKKLRLPRSLQVCLSVNLTNRPTLFVVGNVPHLLTTQTQTQTQTWGPGWPWHHHGVDQGRLFSQREEREHFHLCGPGRRPGDATADHPTCKYVSHCFFPSLLAAVLQFHGPDDWLIFTLLYFAWACSSSHHSSAPSHIPKKKQASEIQHSKILKHLSDCPLTNKYLTDCAPSHIHTHIHTHTTHTYVI